MKIDKTAEVKSDGYLPLWKFLDIIHCTTERVQIYVVGGSEGIKDRVRDWYLTEDVFKDGWDNSAEYKRLMEYYADVPIWNVTAELDCVLYAPSISGHVHTTTIVARCHYKDLRDAYAREQSDIKKAKRKEYRQKRKEASNDNT